MRQAQPLVRACKDCGVVESRFTVLSQKSLCPSCGTERMMEALRQMRAKEGPIYDKWLYRITHFRDGKGNN